MTGEICYKKTVGELEQIPEWLIQILDIESGDTVCALCNGYETDCQNYCPTGILDDWELVEVREKGVTG